MNFLTSTASQMVAAPKGILAADESTGTLTKRFERLGIESTADSRRDYREMLFTTPGLADKTSGVILYDETFHQRTSDGRFFPALLEDLGVLPGIKVDTGAKALAGRPDETVTEGLDGLRDRLEAYAKLGARFAKWRAVITIGPSMPSAYCIEVNAHALARYAALAQEAGLVPIVEPEVLMDGDHSIERCYEATRATLLEVFDQLLRQRVDLRGMLLKPNMVLSGSECPERAPPEEVAEMTLTCFKVAVPAAVPGIVFLSGGQSDDEATRNLDAINRLAAREGAPWELSFSYGRGLQAAPLQAWRGRPENVKAAQDAYYHRAKVTAAARQGRYTRDMEKETAAAG